MKPMKYKSECICVALLKNQHFKVHYSRARAAKILRLAWWRICYVLFRKSCKRGVFSWVDIARVACSIPSRTGKQNLSAAMVLGFTPVEQLSAQLNTPLKIFFLLLFQWIHFIKFHHKNLLLLKCLKRCSGSICHLMCKILVIINHRERQLVAK